MGSRPFGRDDYVRKFSALASTYALARERDRFLSTAVDLESLLAARLPELTVEVPAGARDCPGLRAGLFERSA